MWDPRICGAFVARSGRRKRAAGASGAEDLMSLSKRENAAAFPTAIVVGIIFGAVCALGLAWVVTGLK